jgi:hypothetical protein
MLTPLNRYWQWPTYACDTGIASHAARRGEVAGAGAPAESGAGQKNASGADIDAVHRE